MITIIRRVRIFISRMISLVEFKVKHPNVRIINPLMVGKYYSQDGQDLFLSSLLFNEIKKNKINNIVDIGCNDPVKFSNSLFFEQVFSCNTLAIDPLIEFKEKWKNNRPNATFINCAVGSSLGFVVIEVPINDKSDNMFSSVQGATSKSTALEHENRKVECRTVSSILSEHEFNQVLLMSIDVEGFEMEALKGIDFESSSIKCLCIENNSSKLYGDEEIREFLKNKGYYFVARIGTLDDVYIHRTVKQGYL